MDMGTCIGKLVLSQEFSDVSIVVGLDGEVFPAHKLILSARCSYFRNMFYGSGMKESRDAICRFEHDDPRVFKTMLYHLYSRPMEESLEPRHMVMCLITAEKFGIDSFRDFCLASLEKDVSITTACEILTLLEELYEDERTIVRNTMQKCFKYILENLEEILQDGGHHILPQKTFERILQVPDLNCPEIDLYKGVTSWHVHNNGSFSNSRDTFLNQLSMLDLRLIELSSLAECIHTSGAFSQDEMANLYRRRITLGQFENSSRVERKFGVLFHGGIEYNSRPYDVIASLSKTDLLISQSDVISFLNTYNFTYLSLTNYAAVLVFSMETHSQGLCGDALADFVDRGGCIVLCHALGCLSGRITTSQYMPVQRIEPIAGEYRSLHLGKIVNPSHPILEGVKDIKVRCMPNFVWNCKPTEDTKVIAEWSDGNVLACEKEVGKGRIVFLNLYPVSTKVVIVGLEKDCDGHTLLRNSLMYASHHPCQWL